MYPKEKFDMTAFGQAVKEARENLGLSREKLAEKLDLAPRYIMYIETRGQHPSLQKLYEIATLFNISIDQFFFPNNTESKTTPRRQLDAYSCLWIVVIFAWGSYKIAGSISKLFP